MRPSFAHFAPIIAAALLLAPLSVGAQFTGSTRPVSLVISGGATVPTGNFKDYHDLGMHADVSLLLNVFGQSLRLRPELTYGRFSISDKLRSTLGLSTQARAAFLPNGRSAATVAYSSDAVSTLLGGFGNIEIPLASGLYVLAGVGAIDLKTDATTTGTSLSSTKLAYNGGAGLRFKIGGIAGFIEGRLTDIAVEKGKALFKDVRTVPVSFGLVF
jgi:hypothetical protein